MIVDAAALIAILRSKPDAKRFADAIGEADICRISASTYLEVSIVIDVQRDPIASRKVDDLIDRGRMKVEPFTQAQAEIARQAYRDFGKGSGHPARLNFGDCFAYALARELKEPLLFKGDDFAHTDIEAA